MYQFVLRTDVNAARFVLPQDRQGSRTGKNDKNRLFQVVIVYKTMKS